MTENMENPKEKPEGGTPAAASGGKERLDVLLVELGLAPSREKARAMVMSGVVFVGNQRIDKSGHRIDRQSDLRIHGPSLAYVSRGGLKLEKGLAVFPVKLQGCRVLDIGASTGGFTDCALQNGAAGVVAVDVGYGQLDWKLRQDPRVRVMEKTNARYLKLEDIGEPVDFVTIDVAFISLDKIFPVLPGLMKPGAQGIALIKPQFEAGRENVGKKGVVRDPKVHAAVIEKVLQELERSGLTALGLDYSPIRGPEGNIEYLLWFGYQTGISPDYDHGQTHGLVDKAFQTLKGGDTA